MKIPFFGIANTLTAEKKEMIELTSEICQSDFQLQGSQNKIFEKKVAEIINRNFCITVGSGTDALYFALKALGVGDGDEVLVTSVSFVASASCILRVGAKPIFVDIHPETMMMSASDAISKKTIQTKAVILVHLFGQMYPADEYSQLKKINVPIVEDAAQALGCKNELGSAGSLGEVSCLSFDPTKILGSLSSGGMVATNNQDISKVIRKVKFHGRSETGEYECVGVNSQLPELSAAFLMKRLQKIDLLIRQRTEIANYFIQELIKIDTIQIIGTSYGVNNTWQKFVILVPDRTRFIQHMRSHGIEAKPQYERSLCEEPVFAVRASNCPQAQKICERAVGLPIYPGLSEIEKSYIVQKVNEALCV